jgi:hypothetical protein
MLPKRPNPLVVSLVLAVFGAASASARAAEGSGGPSAIGGRPASAPASAPSPAPIAPPLGVPDKPRPWAENVSEEAQKKAMSLFDAGNKLFEESQHAAALAEYREALKTWDHPAIRYNAAVALINLDQPLAAYENLELALRYGDAPLAPETYQQALTYRKLLRGQLAELKVACAEPGAEVTLDGAQLFVAPGEATRWVMPGAHQLIAGKAGFLAETRALTLVGGRSSVERLVLEEIQPPTMKPVRRWRAWKPWAVVGGGALLALVGVPLILDARSNFNSYDAMVTAACGNGCPPGTLPQSALDAHDTARIENIVAVSLFSVGGALIAGGVALVVLNQSHLVPVEDRPPAIVAPLLGPGLVGLSVGFQR